ncbi:MAG: peptidoglycan DD-metalloendopeptidase family protein [Bacteroidales bacterium]|nr:peptidoglycan DD-metalloendopeptidase family protein [Bacteroidales bacterium]
MRSQYRYIIFFVLLLVSTQLFAQTKTDLQKEKTRLENQISITSQLLKKNSDNKNLTLEQLQLINSQVQAQQALIDNINASIKATNEEIEGKRQKIAKLKDDLQQLKDEYARMIYFAYLTRSPEMRLMYVFSSSSMTQAFQRMKYFQEYAAIRKRQAVLIVEMQAEIESSIAELEIARQEKVDLLKELEQTKAKLDSQIQEKKDIADGLKKKETELKEQMRKQQKQANNLQAQIQEIIKKEIEASKKNNVVDNNNNNNNNNSGSKTEYVMSPDEKRISNTFEGNKGRLPWPVSQGIIISSFGEHPHPVLAGIKVKNNGIDISVPAGEEARSVFEGKVSGIISLPNGNKALIIRHGEYLTVYSNIKDVKVQKDQTVTAKQELGLVGQNDNKQYVLHFEVWNEKQLQNPAYWISK